MNICKDTVIGGRYRVIEKIGAGGMAVVYRCNDEKLGRDVTVKILKEEYASDEKFKQRFKSEAYSVARLSHPNIVNVYDSGEDNGICYIVMEYVDGTSLKEVIEENAPLSSVTVLSIASQISSALINAHKNHIIHRDIKPQNILVARDGTVKVTDFGIAKGVSDSTLTAKSDSLGSVYYLSPEQARGGYVDERSDIYSLGITMFEMITGEVPFDGDNSIAVAIKQISEELPDIGEINPDADELLEQIIYKATNKKADERYQNISLMNEDIRNAMAEITGGGAYDDDDDDDGDYTYDDKEEIAYNEIKPRRKEPEYDDDYDYDKSSEKKVVAAAVITAVIIIAVISFFGYRYIFGGKSPGGGEMPNLVGMTLEDAKLEAAGKNINLEVNEEAFNDDYDSGVIYYQSKEAGKKIKNNETVGISVSLGHQTGEMPDLLYTEENEAAKTVRGLAGAEADIKYVYDDTIPEGLVCSQLPDAGTSINSSTKVILTISKGPEVRTTTVPKITGLSIDAAESALEAADLSIGNISRVESASAPKDIVIKQEVAAGEEVDKDTRINIVVSKGVLKYIPTEDELDDVSNENTNNETENNQTAEPVAGTDDNNNTDEQKSGTLSFSVDLPAGTEGTVNVRMVKIENGTSSSDVYNNSVDASQFPFSVSVTGKGAAEVQLFINDSYQWSQYVNFSEGGN